MPTDHLQYQYKPTNLTESEPNKFKEENLRTVEMIINLGPQHPSTHGVLRLEVLMDGEIIKDVVPHLGYLHRCFEKHAENLPYNQIIPVVDRMDYVAAMNSEHIYALDVERMLGIADQIPKRVEYIRVLMAELNRISSHFIAIGTYGMDIGAFTPFFWLMRDRDIFYVCSSGRLAHDFYITTSGLVDCFMICRLALKIAAANSFNISNQNLLSLKNC